MSKHRIKFSKLGMAKYISHLDLLRCFTRAIMRAELPVKYSQGFNPHQKLTFSLPLSIGVTSECEFADIDFEDGISHEEIRDRLDASLPPDITVLDVYEIRDNANDIVSAEYKVSLFSDEPITQDLINGFFAQSEVIITKKTKKKGEKQVNLMDFIKGLGPISEPAESDDEYGGYKTDFNIILSAGGKSNLKPEIAVNALCEYIGSVKSRDIHRTKIYCCIDGNVLKEFE